jgi:hypothetical protein
VLKSVAGQSAFQLAVMYGLVTHGDAVFGVPAAAAAPGASVHYTLVFNAFVMMQLFNQARAPAGWWCSSVCLRSVSPSAPFACVMHVLPVCHREY